MADYHLLQNLETSDMDAALYQAVVDQNLDLVEMYLRNSADWTTRHGHYYFTPLHQAAESENFLIAQMLLYYGASTNAQDYFKRTPFHLSFGGSSAYVENFVQLFIDRGADATLKDQWNRNGIHLSAKCGMWKILGKLLAVDNDVDAATTDGKTALHLALESKHSSGIAILKVAQLLIGHGADINATDNLGKTPLDYAVENFGNCPDDRDKMEICYYLLKHVALLSLQKPQKLDALNLIKSKVIKSKVELLTCYSDFNEELDRMKTTEVLECSGITYHDVLVKNDESLMLCLRNRNVRSTLYSGDYKELFPNYADTLEMKCVDNLEVFKNKDKFIEVLQETIGLYLKNDDVIHTISAYYNDKDFLKCCGYVPKAYRQMKKKKSSKRKL